MDGPSAPPLFALDGAALDRLMPLHLCIAADGMVVSVGPTLAKIGGGAGLLGEPFFDHFTIRRPGGITTMEALTRRSGVRMHLMLRHAADTALRGIAMPMGGGGFILNLSFGIALAEAVRRHALTDTDFATTDLAIELLYLVEAKSAVMDEMRDLNRRLQGAKSAAEEQARTDTLTGLRNRRAMDRTMAHLIETRQAFGLMHLDLDFFKEVNDSLGHAAGDHVLQEVAAILTAETRRGDIVARVGGDEFVILFPGLVDQEKLESVARRVLERIARPIDFEGAACRISGSIGINCSLNYRHPAADRMLTDADHALYAAKHAGRGCYRLHQAGQEPTEDGETAPDGPGTDLR